MNATERNETLQLSAGIIFALQHHLPTDDYTPYDAQKAQEGLMKIHNSNQDTYTYERDALVHTLENEVDDLQNEVDEANERIDHLEEACKEKDDENAKLNVAYGELQDKIDILESQLSKRCDESELLKSNIELEKQMREYKEEYEREKKTSQRLFNELAELRQIEKWKKKYVSRNPLCLLCGQSRYSRERDVYGYCPLLRDCFTCPDCSKRMCARAYNTFNGEHISLGEMMMTRHDDDRDEIKRTLEQYCENKVPSYLLTAYPNLTTDFEVMDMINEWFMKSVEQPNEIFKLISYYRDRLSVCNDTHL